MNPQAELSSFLNGRTNSLRIFKSGPASQVSIARKLVDQGRNVAIVAPGAREFKIISGLLELFFPNVDDTAAPVWERNHTTFSPYLAKMPSAEEWGDRWASLYSLVYGPKPRVTLLTADNLLPRWPRQSVLESNWETLVQGEDMAPDLIAEQAITWGYRHTKLVSMPGDMAIRGDIMDIYAPGYPYPLRLDFFGDTLEDIRLFDPASQRSRASLREAVILPVAPGLAAPSEHDKLRDRWAGLRRTGELDAAAEQQLSEMLNQSDGRVWPGVFYEESAGLEDFFPEDTVFILADGGALRSRIEDHENSWHDLIDRETREKGLRWPLRYLCRTPEAARHSWRDLPHIVFEELTLGREKDGMDLPERQLGEFADLFWQPEQQRRPWQALMDSLKRWQSEGMRTILAFSSERSRKKFLTLTEGEGLGVSLEYSERTAGTMALVSSLAHGMELEWAGLRVLGENVIQPRPVGTGRRTDSAFKGMDRYDELAEGDLLVHRDYGLSEFAGLHSMRIGDVENDYLLLHFSGDDKLYLPVDRLNLIQRFKGPEGAGGRLDKLGGSRWKKTTAAVRKAIEKIAHDLVEMYAFRRVSKGYSYGPLDEMYHEFEASFGFEETPDQDRAVRDVFEDMEKDEPMDRLVCGDVGFGKTEVALRAAFRAALEGRQTVLLCPTTVLAEQHYQTFLKRMEGFPIRVGMLSRFVPRATQKTTLAATQRGEVDILIGTHRLLSKDVEVPELGLLILDEEQRFGVKHKERLKKLRKSVDVLTLTATPIPRTLQLSLSGVRGLSVIETPPLDRKPVQTAILARDKGELAAVLKRELDRGGQVFWVYNRVNGLERVAEFVRELAPEARVSMAHGQMSEKALEKAMHEFWHHETDVLVCTAIVESGLDFPNANTLIVDQAQMFGLGQLYQLRGRVGRSERQAYAHFVVPSVDELPPKVRKRLQIILNLDYLGAGFKVAMEDLRLRGAGNILGEAQSGRIAKVGLDLFLEMLEEEVRRLRGDKNLRTTEPELNFVFEAHIPGDYVPEARERLRYYRALSSAGDTGTLLDLEAELRDRFGHLPQELDNFFGILGLKRVLAQLQCVRADLFPGRMVLSWEEDTEAVTPDRLIAWVGARQGQAKLLPPARLEFRFPETGVLREALEGAGAELLELADTDNAPKDGARE